MPSKLFAAAPKMAYHAILVVERRTAARRRPPASR